MKIPVLFASLALVAIPLGAWFSGCSNGNPASPSSPPLGDSGLPLDDGSSPVDSGTTPSGDSSAPGTDSGAANDSGTTPSDGGTGDANTGDSASPCAAGAGTTVFAKFDFAATANTLNGGKGQLLSVNVCDSVVWQNDDVGAEHGVLSPPDVGSLFNTGTLVGTAADGGAAFPAVKFTTAGTYSYDCAIHGNMMIGQITVK
jgi:plastocyanin